ncbi:MAG: Glycosyl transferase, group 1 [Candidatus Shapirobacteria bacterium GW2011_GWE1_38_92]|uniref:Glycosyl transferase, group 1 n=3 Tax=Candidatus Shapironibacteriota TaxID=1752721 RepID=A0A0G0JUZ8_9BACT|nr:MAG: Glycosyl transferase, group 1 [Candidatus Shapirobacteria bacterium GW2011_GWE2_38_30]KKQ92830.1 MAG: Glycosyl transferase, group 1 [Candidatus Shapirobacteria bacterium GW2011_GWE1_38_92]OGL56318.1 MAG: hypothetical protein A2367_03405 [Candidatus Shapirobacteria bacterium RIFOXYB1_FULL_38_38]
MNILFDHQIFSVQEYGGISRAFAELFNELKKLEVNCSVSLKLSNNYYLSDVGQKIFFKNYSFPGKLTLMDLVNKMFSILKIRASSFDIFHPTYYDPYFLNYINHKPFVITVYDLIHEKFLYKLPSSKVTLEKKKLLINKAKRIIAISETTKKDIVEIYGINPNKIEVVYLGNSIIPNNIYVEMKLPKKYILYVGGRQNYKNFDLFLRSITRFLLEKNIFLFCAGGGGFKENEIKLFEELKLVNRIKQQEVTDDELAKCYAGALCFVFPSTYEGFGIPILEAFSCNCPVVLSNISCFKEVAKDAAEYFEPTSEISILKSIEKVTKSKRRRGILIAKGRKRLEYFSWKKCAEETLEVYHSL